MTMSDTEPTAQPAASTAPVRAPEPDETVVARTTNGTERRKERGVTVRVLVYVVAAHLMAFYLWLMFAVVGGH
jgi:hypothetical protein